MKRIWRPVPSAVNVAVGNKARRSRAHAEAVKRWRGHQPVRVAGSDRRRIRHANGARPGPGFRFGGASAFRPQLERCVIVLDVRDTGPLLLAGSDTPLLAAVRNLAAGRCAGGFRALGDGTVLGRRALSCS